MHSSQSVDNGWEWSEIAIPLLRGSDWCSIQSLLLSGGRLSKDYPQVPTGYIVTVHPTHSRKKHIRVESPENAQDFVNMNGKRLTYRKHVTATFDQPKFGFLVLQKIQLGCGEANHKKEIICFACIAISVYCYITITVYLSKIPPIRANNTSIN